MTVLILGLLLFLGVHSVRIVADGWRTAQIARLGANRWKRLYTLASVAGLVLIVWGFGMARADTAVLWAPPPWTRWAAALFTAVAFILLTAAYVPGTRYPAGRVSRDAVAIVVGLAAWALFAAFVHGRMTGIPLIA